MKYCIKITLLFCFYIVNYFNIFALNSEVVSLIQDPDRMFSAVIFFFMWSFVFIERDVNSQL